MKTSATELMKKLKYIEEEIDDIHRNDEAESYIPVEKSTEEGHVTYVLAYEPNYDFIGNRTRVAALYQEEVNIKKVLNEYNQKTMVNGYSFNINEALIRLGQLKSEVRTLTNISRQGSYIRDGYRENLKRAVYDPNLVKDELRRKQRELSALQVAVDRTNLFSEIEYID